MKMVVASSRLGGTPSMRAVLLSLFTILCLLLAVAPAMAGAFYSNGPINGTTDGWTINSGFSVTDSFSVPDLYAIADLHIGVWLLPGETVSSVQMDLGTSPFGTNVFSGVLTATGSTDLGTNQYGYDIQQVDFTFWPPIDPGEGSYWLTLSNAVAPSGDPIYWDENSGVGCWGGGCPSTAYENTLGSIPSEAFTVTGPIKLTPEPSSIMLFGSGILGLAGL